MMTQPSVERLIELIRKQLTEVVGPALPEDGPRSAVGMIDHLLQTIQTRAENEIDWMTKQIADITDLAERAVTLGDVSPRVSDAIGASKAATTGSLTASRVTADYARAAEILSLILEETVTGDSATAHEARSLLDREANWGVQVVGDFVLVAP